MKPQNVSLALLMLVPWNILDTHEGYYCFSVALEGLELHTWVLYGGCLYSYMTDTSQGYLPGLTKSLFTPRLGLICPLIAEYLFSTAASSKGKGFLPLQTLLSMPSLSVLSVVTATLLILLCD